MNEATVAFDANNHLGETPIWSQEDQALWWVNCEEPPEIHRWSPTTGEHSKWDFPDRVGGFVHKADGGLLVALADGLYDFDPETGKMQVRAKSGLPPQIKLHECHCDRQGRFWIGAYDHDFGQDRGARKASWFRLDGDKLTPVIDGVAVANGLAFSPDGTRVYMADAPSRSVNVYDYGPATGTPSNPQLFFKLEDGEGFPDGATVDSEGGYWLANVAAGRLRRYLPDGTLERIVELPFSNPTKPAFGGPDLATLYVTSCQLDLPVYNQPTIDNGAVFAVETGFGGVAETPLKD